MDTDNNTSNNIEKLLEELTGLLEQKKQEAIVAGGCIHSLKETSRAHLNHVEKIREELQTLVSSGKMTTEVANLILTYVSRSATVIGDCLNSFRSRYDIKSGEVLAYDNLVSVVKLKVDTAAKKDDQLSTSDSNQTPEENSEVDAVLQVASPLSGEEKEVTSSSAGSTDVVENNPTDASESLKKKSSRSPRRPDQRGKLGETVSRLKEIRKKRKIDK